jgi:hypothetical protein
MRYIQQEPLIEMPIMILWRRRQEYGDTVIGNLLITLAQIALTFAVVLRLILRDFHFPNIGALSRSFLVVLMRGD